MTGRKGLMVKDSRGRVTYQQRRNDVRRLTVYVLSDSNFSWPVCGTLPSFRAAES
jgi:hypothetical protein